jgi:hypothetical protein
VWIFAAIARDLTGGRPQSVPAGDGPGSQDTLL